MKDFYLMPTEGGPDFEIKTTGIPQLSGGLDNYIYLLLTMGDWWGNEEADDDGQFSSNLPDILASTTLTNATRLDVIAEVKRLMCSLISAGIAESVEVDAEIPSSGTLYISIEVTEPDHEESDTYIYALNWASQKITVQEALW